VKAGGAKDARKVDAPMSHDAKKDPAEVPVRAVLSGEADPYGWVERAVWTERMLDALRRGGPEGGRWYWLHDKVFAERTLRAAYARVKRNGGAPGVDGMTVEAFGSRLDEEIARLRTAWEAGTYRPQAIRRTWIPKPGTDEQRPLGIPTVRDRVVQAALVLVLEPIFEPTFSEHSHGFRPGRNAHGALRAVLDHLKDGKVWVVDADLKAYYDSIPHERLLAAVHRKITDRRVLELIGAFLKAGVLEGAELTEPEAGTPQGGVASPLLANIYLNDLDHRMAQSGMAMERYADDIVILCRTQEEAERALAMVRDWTAQAGLSLHPTKTRVVDLGQPGAYVDFLGYRFQRHTDRKGKDRILRLVRPKSLAKIKDKLRARTPRKSGQSLAVQIAQLNPILSGWFNYFRSVTQPNHAVLDKLVRRRLRSMLCKRHGQSMIWGRGDAQVRWPKAFFAEQGLFSLEVAHARYVQAHRRAH
jgi:RNA-directed DNA polymerase